MRAECVKIHNFRTFKNETIQICPYSLLVGANNAGKSNFIDAIRIFYEKDVKFVESRDFPIFATEDNESWIEITFRPTTDEFLMLKTEYQNPDGTFTVRKYLKSDQKDSDGKTKSDIYAYVDGSLSESRFYGVKNVQQSKFGKIIYIPAVNKLDDVTKLSGPSALRELINSVFKKVIENSPSYQHLTDAFQKFGDEVKDESTSDGQSLKQLESDISEEIVDWNSKFELVVNPLSQDEIIKYSIDHKIHDNLLNQSLDSTSFGQGFQRQLIYSIIKISSQYVNKDKTSEKKEFYPELTWILFEEPEAFLHQNQIISLNQSFQELIQDTKTQITISTHNPEFVCANIEDIPSIIRLSRITSSTEVGQINDATISKIFIENQKDLANWITANIKVDPDDLLLDMESIKYSLWLDSRRSNAFFANKVLLVEGPSEIALFNLLIKEGKISNPKNDIFILDTMGKFNIHRFMNLFKELKIFHGVIFDADGGKYPIVDQTIKNSINPYTLSVNTFPIDLESFLSIPKCKDPRRKPQNIILNYNQKNYDANALAQLTKLIENTIK